MPADAAAQAPTPDAAAGLRVEVCSDAAALRRFTARAAGLSESPLHSALQRVALQVASCKGAAGTGAPVAGSALLESVGCLGAPLPALCGRRGAADGVVLFAAAEATAELTFRVDGQGNVTARWAGGDKALPGLAAFHPSGTPAGPAQLQRAGSLLHARFRPLGGAEAFFVVPPGAESLLPAAAASTGLASAWLDGTWELRVAPAREPGGVPGLALVLGVRSTTLARAATRHFLDGLRQRYGLVEAPLGARAAFGGRSGGCLPGLTVLPELAPCWVWSDAALAVAWNADVLEDALGAGAPTTADARPAPEGSTDGLQVDFAAMMAADARGSAGDAADQVRVPWTSLRATPVAGQPGALDVTLTGGPP